MDIQILTQLIFSGIALGMIYAVVAFGYQLTDPEIRALAVHVRALSAPR